MRNAYRLVVGKLEAKRPLRGIRRWREIIKMGIREMWFEAVDWVDMA
jgi:hypothetical protein